MAQETRYASQTRVLPGLHVDDGVEGEATPALASAFLPLESSSSLSASAPLLLSIPGCCSAAVGSPPARVRTRSERCCAVAIGNGGSEGARKKNSRDGQKKTLSSPSLSELRWV